MACTEAQDQKRCMSLRQISRSLRARTSWSISAWLQRGGYGTHQSTGRQAGHELHITARDSKHPLRTDSIIARPNECCSGHRLHPVVKRGTRENYEQPYFANIVITYHTLASFANHGRTDVSSVMSSAVLTALLCLNSARGF